MHLRPVDRRRGPRYRVAHSSIASFGEKGTYPVVIREVGEYGLRLMCVRRIPVDSVAQVRLSFPGASFQRSLRVVRCEKTRGGYLLAGEFTQGNEVGTRPVQSYLDYVSRATGALRPGKKPWAAFPFNRASGESRDEPVQVRPA